MELSLFVKGILIGLAVSVPLGPMGLLAVQRTLNKGRTSGFMSGLGIATADTIFALIAAIGLTFIINFLNEQKLYFQILGGLVILMVGFRIFIANPVKQLRANRIKRIRPVEEFISILLLALSNPLTILMFVAVFAGFKLSGDLNHFGSTFYVVTGIFLGASLSWFFISTIITRFRKRFRLRTIFWFNKLSGSVIFIFGLAAIFSLLLSHG
ncbi:MAG: LysE family translocator [Bacteroidales bacterium]|nr:MAG: LysE family translocator [Bacteroidales bacterium]